ncbi:MAG: GtrA family protein [Acholeplasmataceae bacterium]|nr:GtrA family protein [Acholeplasmataceae bacterium]
MENNLTEELKPQIKLTKRDHYIHALKFLLFSISAGVIQISSFALFSDVAHLTTKLSYFISIVLSVIWNYTFNRKFTFKSANNIPIAMLKVAGYNAIFITASTWWVGELTTDVSGFIKYLVIFLTMVVNLITEFLFTKFYVYHNAINTAVKPQK